MKPAWMREEEVMPSAFARNAPEAYHIRQ